MPLSPPRVGFPTPQVLSSMTEDHTAACLMSGGSGASATWPTAAQAYFFPVQIDRAVTYTRAWWLNGATAAGNVDVALYTIANATATRVGGTGAVAQAGVSAMQTATVSIAVTPGLYYLAMGLSLATGTTWRTGSAATLLRGAGIFQLTTATHPIPSSASVTAVTFGASMVFGLSELTTI